MKPLLSLTTIAVCMLFATGCADMMNKVGIGTTPAKESSAAPAPTTASAPTALPFDVTIGGQKAAVASASAAYATIAQPVSADAAIEVGAPFETVIINAFPCDAAGAVANGVQPAIIMFKKGEKSALDGTMDKKKLAAGNYIANVVIAEKGTARVLFDVK